MRTLLVDDERLARARLRKLLLAHPRITIIAEADSVASARAAIAEHKPELVFLDIEMPGGSGFELLRERIECSVVFVTAYNQYALKAFEVGAIDYLVKPIKVSRLAQTIERLHTRTGPARDCLYLKNTGQMQVVDVEQIVLVSASGDRSELHLRDGSVVRQSEALRHWESRLGSGFLRIHRSHLISLRYVEAIERSGVSTSQVRLQGYAEAVGISRSRLAALKHALRNLT